MELDLDAGGSSDSKIKLRAGAAVLCPVSLDVELGHAWGLSNILYLTYTYQGDSAAVSWRLRAKRAVRWKLTCMYLCRFVPDRL